MKNKYIFPAHNRHTSKLTLAVLAFVGVTLALFILLYADLQLHEQYAIAGYEQSEWIKCLNEGEVNRVLSGDEIECIYGVRPYTEYEPGTWEYIHSFCTLLPEECTK